MDSKVFEDIVNQRRSVRVFDKSPVPEAVIEKCLDLALFAPNSSNLQPWEFHWVRTEPLRKKLVQACLSQAAASTAAELIVCVARTDTWPRARLDMIAQMTAKQAQGEKIPDAAWAYYRKLVPVVYRQGWLSIFGHMKKVIFFLIGLRKAVPREPTSHQDMRVWAVKSTALACENLMLAATAFGYDSCPMEGMDSRRIRKMLRLTRSSSVVMVIAIGKRAANAGTLPRIRGERGRHVIHH